mmetsp:Transcript_26278/g.77699  ORF Transcript_26278/g.77699 Transcript_26278/m.77699 type:complete len:221 (-) Transcript_26278:76-738(-)
METLKSGDVPSLVTNIEVMQILSDRIEVRRQADEADEAAPAARRRRKDSKLRHRDWVEETVLEYLQGTPCATADKGRMPEFVGKLRGQKKPIAAQTKRSAKATGSTSMDSESGNHHADDDRGENGTNERQDEEFGLTDGETLQVLNLMPREPVEIHLLVEDLPSRMSEERQAELLELVGQYSGADDPGEEELDDAEDFEEEEIVGDVEEEGDKDSGNGYR